MALDVKTTKDAAGTAFNVGVKADSDASYVGVQVTTDLVGNANQIATETSAAAILATAGATTGAAVTTDANGTLQQYLRGLVVLIVNFLSRLPAALGAGGGLKVDGSGTALPTSDNGPAWTSSYLHTASADATGIVDVTAAPSAGQKIVIDDIIVSVDTAMWVLFEEETSGTDILKLYLAANSAAQITPRGRIKLPVADKKLRMDTSVAGNVSVTVVYHSEA